MKGEIDDICANFDHKLLVLFKERLEVEQRIMEQELYVVRLTLSILHSGEAQVKKEEVEVKIREFEEKERKLKHLKEVLQES